MSEELRSALVWLVYFLALELASHFKLGRIPTAGMLLAACAFALWLNPTFTLSGTIWGGISWWHPIADGVIVFAVVLVTHLLYRISAAYLISVGLAIAITAGLHALGVIKR